MPVPPPDLPVPLPDMPVPVPDMPGPVPDMPGPVPDMPVPDMPVPDMAIILPDMATPDQMIPDQMVPDQLVPDQTVPDQLIPDMLIPDLPPPSCTDKIKNQDETGVDCGGTKCSKCAPGGGCKVGSDCAQKKCYMGICIDPLNAACTATTPAKVHKGGGFTSSRLHATDSTMRGISIPRLSRCH